MSQRTPVRQQFSSGNTAGQQTPTSGRSTGKFSQSGSRTRSASSNNYSPNRVLGGTTLIVDGMSSPKNSMPSSFYRSGSSTGDAHIKHLSRQIHQVPFKAPPTSAAGPASSVAFGSTSGSARDAHYKDLLKRSSSPNRGYAVEWGTPGGQGSAAFRSRSPNACAHMKGVVMSDPKYVPEGKTFVRQQNSAAYRSKSSIGDAHIKAMRKPYDSTAAMSDFSKGIKGGASASFRSTTSIGDAHIKAVPKMADICVTYRNQD